MAKTFLTDGCWCIAHFNSGEDAYFRARQMGPIYLECCHCHQQNAFLIPAKIGLSQQKRCEYCKELVEYRTLSLSESLALSMDVRGGLLYGNRLGAGGIMHVVLPDTHPEFNTLIIDLNNGKCYDVIEAKDHLILWNIAVIVINHLSGFFEAQVSNIRRTKGNFLDDRNVVVLSQGFVNYGEAINLCNIRFSKTEVSLLEELIPDIFQETGVFLLSKFDKNLTKAQEKRIYSNLMKYCCDFIRKNYARRVLAITKEN